MSDKSFMALISTECQYTECHPNECLSEQCSKMKWPTFKKPTCESKSTCQLHQPDTSGLFMFTLTWEVERFS